MARRFTASSDGHVRFGATGKTTWAGTHVVVLKREAEDVTSTILSSGTTSLTRGDWYLESNNNMAFWNDTNDHYVSSSVSVETTDGWVLLAMTKSSGTTTPRFHKYVFSTATWTHANGSGTSADVEAASVWCVGRAIEYDENNDAEFAVAGIWTDVLTDSQIESLASSLQAWFALQPVSLWVFDQAATTMSVRDWTGVNHEAATGGTSVGVGSPPLNYGAPVIDNQELSSGGAPVDLVVQDATHGHAAESPALTQTHALTVADATHAHSAESPTLTQGQQLVVQDATHGHSAESPALTQVHVLVVQDALHAHTAESPAVHEPSDWTEVWCEDFTGISSGDFLPQTGWTDDGGGGWEVFNSGGTDVLFNLGSGPLVVHRDTGDVVHRITSHYKIGASPSSISGLVCCVEDDDNYMGFEIVKTAGESKAVTYSRVAATDDELDSTNIAFSHEDFHDLIIEFDGVDTVRSYIDDELIHTVTVPSGLRTNTRGGAVQFAGGANWDDICAYSGTPVVDLEPADATHAHSADSPTLTQVHNLTVQDALHAHTAESPALTQAHSLTVADTLHAHTADTPALTQVHQLAVADATHAHSADSPTLTGGATLTVQDAVHGHTVESPALTQVHVLAVADALHAHSADAPTLTQLHVLVVADTLHAHRADNVILNSGLPPTITGPLTTRAGGADRVTRHAELERTTRP